MGNFKKALQFYKKSFQRLENLEEYFFCKIQNLFWKKIVPNIEKWEVPKSRKKFSIKSYLIHLFLTITSFFNILKIKCKGLKIAHFLIDINNTDNYYDFRSQKIFEIIPPEKTVNFFHINSLKYSLKTIFKKHNAIYLESIYFILKPFLKRRGHSYNLEKLRKNLTDQEFNFLVTLLKEYEEYLNLSYYTIIIATLIFRFLKINLFLAIDDSRNVNEFLIVCRKLKINSIGYMHARFNEFHLGLFYYPFDIYLVWSEYFKKKLLSLSSNYKDINIIVCGHPRIQKQINKITINKEHFNVMWVGESNVKYEEILPYITALKKVRGLNSIIFRGKPSTVFPESFIESLDLKVDMLYVSFLESLKKNNISIVVGTHSTALLESWLVGVPSFGVKTSFDYGSHLWEDNLIDVCDSPSRIKGIVEKLINLSDSQIEYVCKNIWGEDYIFKKDLVKEIIKEQSY